MKITIKTIPHRQQRYDTVGDWYYRCRELVITVSKMSDWRFEMLVAVHELVEAVLCRYAKVEQLDVDRFDKRFNGEGEPGDDPDAPYCWQHCVATGVERIVAAALHVPWKVYDDEVNSL